MYLHIGANIVIPLNDVVAIFEWSQKAKEKNKKNISFFKIASINGQVETIVDGKIKSLIVTSKEKLYLSPISKQTLSKRCIQNVIMGGRMNFD